jgi:hypothetical protein
MAKKIPIARNLFLIIRGERSEHHKADFHPIIICSRKHTAKWEAGATVDGATVFENMAPESAAGNWLLCRYKGYDIVGTPQYFTLFDGKESRDISTISDETFNNAIWWSYDRMPEYLKDKGVHYATDEFTKNRIMQDAGTCELSYAKQEKLKHYLGTLENPEWL